MNGWDIRYSVCGKNQTKPVFTAEYSDQFIFSGKESSHKSFNIQITKKSVKKRSIMSDKSDRREESLYWCRFLCGNCGNHFIGITKATDTRKCQKCGHSQVGFGDVIVTLNYMLIGYSFF